MNSDVLIPYAVKDGKLIHISRVESGENCGCICPSCKMSLGAYKGDKNKHHFRHLNKTECEGALESTLHLLAKEVFKKNKQLNLPDYLLDIDTDINDLELKDLMHKCKNIGRFITIKHGRKTFELVKVEHEINDSELRTQSIFPDAVGIDGGETAFVEFFNTHKVDDNKRDKYQILNKSCVEIDLRPLRNITFTTQEEDEKKIQEFLDNSDNYEWLSHNIPIVEWKTHYREIVTIEEKKREEKRELDKKEQILREKRWKDEQKFHEQFNLSFKKILETSKPNSKYKCEFVNQILSNIELVNIIQSPYKYPWYGGLYGKYYKICSNRKHLNIEKGDSRKALRCLLLCLCRLFSKDDFWDDDYEKCQFNNKNGLNISFDFKQSIEYTYCKKCEYFNYNPAIEGSSCTNPLFVPQDITKNIDEYGAVYSSNWLELLHIPNGIEKYEVRNGTRKISKDAILGCESLKEIIINDSIQCVEANLIFNDKIKKINLKNTDFYIGKDYVTPDYWIGVMNHLWTHNDNNKNDINILACLAKYCKSKIPPLVIDKYILEIYSTIKARHRNIYIKEIDEYL